MTTNQFQLNISVKFTEDFQSHYLQEMLRNFPLIQQQFLTVYQNFLEINMYSQTK